MAGGNFNPAPLRFGASEGTNLEAILNDLRQSMGSAFDVERGTITWIYLNAIARVMNDVFEQNKRLANQWDPVRMTDFLERWEAILGIIPLPTDTLVDRREKVETKLATVGSSATVQVLSDLLSTLLGDVFVSVEHITGDDANAYVPGGVIVPGGATVQDGDWYSTVSYIPIKVVQPDYIDNLTFYETVAQIFSYLDGLVPAWTTYDWFRDSPHFGAGFYLDDDPNLDNEAFD